MKKEVIYQMYEARMVFQILPFFSYGKGDGDHILSKSPSVLHNNIDLLHL